MGKPTKKARRKDPVDHAIEAVSNDVTGRDSGRRLKVEERRDRLIALGRKLFSEHAYDSLSTDELARRAGISAGLLYHYFQSKRGYYVATIRDVAREVSEITRPMPGASFDVALRRALEAFVRFVEKNDRMYRALVRGGIGSDTEINEILEGLRRTNVERIVALLEVEPPSGRLFTAIYGWIGFVEFVCLHWVCSRDLSRKQLIGLMESAMAAVVSAVEK